MLYEVITLRIRNNQNLNIIILGKIRLNNRIFIFLNQPDSTQQHLLNLNNMQKMFANSPGRFIALQVQPVSRDFVNEVRNYFGD